MTRKPKSPAAEYWPGRTTPGWDAVDEAGWESFPASDPPAFSAAPEPPPATRVLDESERAALREALDGEQLAWATYDQFIRDFGPEPPFDRIRESEARHVAALLSLFERYGLEAPENPWPGRVPRFASLSEACAAGVAAEMENQALYERLMRSTRRPDVRAVFQRLASASRERHLPAFRRGAHRGPRGRG